MARAEAIYDAEEWRLAPGASMRDQLDWAAELAAPSGAPDDDP